MCFTPPPHPTKHILASCHYQGTRLCTGIFFQFCLVGRTLFCTRVHGGYGVPLTLNTLKPRQNYRHFADDIFKSISLNENVWMSLKIALKFVPKVRINNIPTLVQTMAWRRPGDKPLSEPMMVSLLTYICVIRPQWVKQLGHSFKI